MKQMITYSPLYIFIFSVILFFADIALFSWYADQQIYLLLAYHILLLFKTIPRFLYGITLVLLTCESFLCYGHLFFPMMYLVPLTIGIYKIKKMLFPSLIPPAAILVCCLSIQILAIEGFFCNLWPSVSYTAFKICATMLMLWCLSLTYKIHGNQGNRL
jgi:hypothetical protein